LRRPAWADVVLVASLIAATTASAGTVNVTFAGRDPVAHNNSSLNVSLNPSASGSGMPTGSATTTMQLGQGGGFDFTVNNPSSTLFLGPGGSTSSTAVLGFCLEMTQFRQSGPNNVNIVPLAGGPSSANGAVTGGMGATPGMLIDEQWSKYLNSVLNPTGGLTATQAAGAFQLAIWNLENGGNDPFGTPGALNFSKGYVEAPAMIVGDATALNMTTTWNNSLSLNQPVGELAHLAAAGANHSHDHTSQPIPPPEPASNLIWLMVGAVAVYPLMRRRSK